MPTFDPIRKIALAMPGVEDATSYGTPALKVKKNLMIRLCEDGDVVFIVGFDKRRILGAAFPGERARGPERAPGGRVDRPGQLALDGDALLGPLGGRIG